MQSENQSTRRKFIKQSVPASALAVTGATLFPKAVHSASGGDESIRIGLVGCGGRGSGAVTDAVAATANVKLVAMADLAKDRLDQAATNLETGIGAAFDVRPDARFVGPESYKQLCAHPDVDYVIHTTPPGLRYLTLREALMNGKHSFVEKPVCVDPFTYHHVLESGKIAKETGLAIVSGTQYRRENSYKAAIQQIHDGLIGELTGAYQYYCGGALWTRGTAADWERWGGFDGMEYQMRNWLYFAWLSGDHITEQAIHNIDAVNWAFGGPPVAAYGSGGRISRNDKQYGNIYDHFSIDYDYANGARVAFKCRQIAGTKGRVTNRFIGTKGTMDIRPSPGSTASVAKDFSGKRLWNNNGRTKNNLPYVEEHKALIASIRAGDPIVEIQGVADSSITATIGREAAYSGQEIKFTDALASRMKLGPDDITLASNPVGPAPVPGQYQFITEPEPTS
ncbi:MAG: oxidoreductase [Planctomycetaceae bacterium]|nr:oxidoreductase [Planctomycetaceae bacterium]HCK42772.1 oxidoreductase [Planctomycetaceae bacterium]